MTGVCEAAGSNPGHHFLASYRRAFVSLCHAQSTSKAVEVGRNPNTCLLEASHTQVCDVSLAFRHARQDKGISPGCRAGGRRCWSCCNRRSCAPFCLSAGCPARARPGASQACERRPDWAGAFRGLIQPAFVCGRQALSTVQRCNSSQNVSAVAACKGEGAEHAAGLPCRLSLALASSQQAPAARAGPGGLLARRLRAAGSPGLDTAPAPVLAPHLLGPAHCRPGRSRVRREACQCPLRRRPRTPLPRRPAWVPGLSRMQRRSQR